MNKKLLSFVAVVAAGALALSGCAGGGRTVATVNGHKISVEDFKGELKLAKFSAEGMYGDKIWDTEIKKGVKFKDQIKEMVLDNMINAELVKEDSEKEGIKVDQKLLDKQFEGFKKNLEANKEQKEKFDKLGLKDEFIKDHMMKNALLLSAYREDFNKKNQSKITDEEAKKIYEQDKESYKVDEVGASHILIKTTDKDNKPLKGEKLKEAEKKANEVLKKAKAGEDFAKLAKEYSDDKASAAKGGDLGLFSRGQMVPEFEKAAFGMEKGQISGLVKSQFGYHIIKVTERINKTTPFEEVNESIKNQLLGQEFTKHMDELVKKAKIEKNKDILKEIDIMKL